MRDWKITFVDTGTHSSIGQRLRAVQRHLDGEEMFLANYSDGLTDVPLPELISFAQKQNTIATFLCVKPNLAYHFVSMNGHGLVTEISDVNGSHIRINGGFFVFRPGIFDYVKDGEELVPGPLQRLAKDNQLSAFRYDGFWAAMDTFKDKQQLEELHARGPAPWEVWKAASPATQA
jgi:glucose-1-phosphate cytidylyltransferase